MLQYPSMSFHILKSSHDNSLSIVNVGRYDYFILLSSYNLFIFMQLSLSICHYFYKNILN